MIEQVTTQDGLIIAIVIRAGFRRDGVQFFTPDEFSQQLGYMNRPRGYKIEAHTHKKLEQKVVRTHEVLYIKSGKVQIGLYDKEHYFIQDCILVTGDVILLASGGHSVEMLDDSELIEIKQGPYSVDDKVSFTPAKKNDER